MITLASVLRTECRWRRAEGRAIRVIIHVKHEGGADHGGRVKTMNHSEYILKVESVEIADGLLRK